MWRSKGCLFFYRYSRRKAAATIQSKVLSETLTLIRPLSADFSIWVSQYTAHYYQNPRLFSLASNPNDQDFSHEADSEFHTSPLISETIDASTDVKASFGDKWSLASNESEPSSEIFNERASFALQESDSSWPEVRDGADEEKGNGDEQMGSLVSEESVEETPDEIPEIDVEKLENVLSLLQSSFDGPLESSLDEMNLTVTEEFVVRIIQTPMINGENLIDFFKWVWEKPEFLLTSRVVDALAQAIGTSSRKRDAYALWDLVKEIGEKDGSVLNTEILNELISLFWKLGKGKAALEVFNMFENLGFEPNADSYYLTIQALCRRSCFEWASSVSEKMLNAGSLPDSEKIGNIISCFCKGSKSKEAHLVHLMAKEKNKYPPQGFVDFLVSSLCKEDETVHPAVEMLEDFPGEARKYAIKPFSSVVRGLCRIKDVKGAKNLIFKMIDAGPPPGNTVFNSVINSFSKAGEMEEARALVRLMESRGLRPDVYTYSVIISGYVKGGEMEEACKVLSEAKKKHSKLCPVTYHTLIRGYCKLEEFDKALNLLSEMKENGVQPNVDEYNKMIQSLCLKALDWRTANKLLEEMNESGLHLNASTRALIKAVKDLEEEQLQTEGGSVEP